MENPATWGKVERCINRAIDRWHQGLNDGMCGLSLARMVADALRRDGLLTGEDVA